MRRFLSTTFWICVPGAVTAFVFAAVYRHLVAVAAGFFLAWAALSAVAALCWCDREGCSGLFNVVLGRQAIAEAGGSDLLIDLQGTQVACVVVLDKEILVCLRGGSGTYRGAGPGQVSDWPDGAELCLTWRNWRRTTVTNDIRQLHTWRTLRTPLHLLGASTRSTLLMSDERHRLLLPPLSPVASRPALSGPS